MGGNAIQAGNGADQIYGTLYDMTFSQSGGNNTATPPSQGIEGVTEVGDTFMMGHNIITAGGGIDIIAGDMHDFNWSVVGGVATQGFTATNINHSNTFILGNNTIKTTGYGADVVYGDMHALNWSATGGYADGTPTTLNPLGGGSNARAIMRLDTVNLGHNAIQVGNGVDTVYGDMQQLSLSLQGGTVTNGGVLVTEGIPFLTDASAIMIDTTITMVGNIITAGSGNDVLFGNMENLNFSATNGTVDGVSTGFIPGDGNAGAYFSGTYINTSGQPRFDTGSTITFGNDTLNAGAGNDFLCGDALNLTGLNAFLVKTDAAGDPNINFIDWGNAVLVDGSGHDQDVFALDDHTGSMMMQGAQIVEHFNLSNDKLVFGNVIGANNSGSASSNAHLLDAVSTFVNFTVNGEKEIAVIFHGAGADSNLASVYQAGINGLISHEAPLTSTAQILSDVAQYIYQSGTATALTGAGNVRDPGTHVVLPATGYTLSTDVTTAAPAHLAADLPQGAVILEGHSTSQAGFSSFTDLASHNALSIHSDTASINPWG